MSNNAYRNIDAQLDKCNFIITPNSHHTLIRRQQLPARCGRGASLSGYCATHAMKIRKQNMRFLEANLV